MLKYLIIVTLFIVNIFFIHYFRSLKNSIFGGIDFTLTGAFLAGYWLGFKEGIIIACLFMLSYYLTSLDFGIHSVSNIVVVSILGLIGAFSGYLGFNICTAAIVGVVCHCFLSDIIAIFFLGEGNILSLFMFDFGAIMFNYIFFRIFF